MIRRISESLDVAYTDLGKLSGSLGAGVGDLRRDLSRLLRDARRDVTKMSRATRKDLERLQRDLTGVTGTRGRKATRSRAGQTRARTSRSTARASSSKR